MVKQNEKMILDQFVSEIIQYREQYSSLVEPDGPLLQKPDQKKLIENESFKKVVIATLILHMLDNDSQGGYWPMIKLLYQKAANNINKFIDYYDVNFTIGVDGEYHPTIALKDEQK